MFNTYYSIVHKKNVYPCVDACNETKKICHFHDISRSIGRFYNTSTGYWKNMLTTSSNHLCRHVTVAQNNKATKDRSIFIAYNCSAPTRRRYSNLTRTMADFSERSQQDEAALSPEPSPSPSKRDSRRRSSGRSSRNRSSGHSSSNHRRKSSLSSSDKRSPKTPRSAKTSKNRLEVAKSAASKISAPSVASSPGAENVSSSRSSTSRKSSKFSRSSGQSEPADDGMNTLDSNRSAERKASRNAARHSEATSSLTSPGTHRAPSSSDRHTPRSGRKSSKFSNRHRRSHESTGGTGIPAPPIAQQESRNRWTT